MSGIHYRDVFRQAFDERAGTTPYPYQYRIASSPEADPNHEALPARGALCQSKTIRNSTN